MEVHLAPDIQKKLDEMERDSGRSNAESLEDAVAGHFDEWSRIRETPARRYDDLESGRVKPIGLAEVRRIMAAKSDEQRRKTLQT